MRKARQAAMCLLCVCLCLCSCRSTAGADEILSDLMAGAPLSYGRVYAGTYPGPAEDFAPLSALYEIQAQEARGIGSYALYLGADLCEVSEVAVFVCRSFAASEKLLPKCMARLAFLQKNAGAEGDVRVYGSIIVMAVGREAQTIFALAGRRL